MDRRRYFVLDEPCPTDEIQSMMGRVVMDKRLPLQAYAPVEPLDPNETKHNPQDIIPSILPSPILTTNRKDFLQNLTSASARTGLSEYFGIEFARSKEERAVLESQVVRRYTLKQHEQYFTELMKHPAYSGDVKQLLARSKGGKAYFVVGFLVTKGAVWSREKGTLYSGSVNIKVPLSMAAGLPLQLDPSVGFSYEQGRSQGSDTTTLQAEIFAISYAVIKINRSFDKNSRHFIKEQPVLGYMARAKAHHLALGADDEEDIVEEDDEEDESLDQPGEKAIENTHDEIIMEELVSEDDSEIFSM